MITPLLSLEIRLGVCAELLNLPFIIDRPRKREALWILKSQFSGKGA